MRRLPIAVASAVTVIAAVLIAMTAQPILACSVGSDFNPVAESDVIVAGRLGAWGEADPSTLSPPLTIGPGFTPIRVTMRVEHVLKGTVPAQITIIDRSSLWKDPARTFWAGGSGACGSFDSDPTAQYAVIGLTVNRDGTYAALRPLTFFLGEAASGPAYDRAVTRLASAGPARLPRTGTGLHADNDMAMGSVFGVLGLTVVALRVIGGLVARRIEKLSVRRLSHAAGACAARR